MVGAGVAGPAGSQSCLSVCWAQGTLCVPGAPGGRHLSPPLFSAVSLGFAMSPSPYWLCDVSKASSSPDFTLLLTVRETVRAVWWLRAQALGWSCWGGGCGEGSKGHRLLCASVPTSVGGA